MNLVTGLCTPVIGNSFQCLSFRRQNTAGENGPVKVYAKYSILNLDGETKFEQRVVSLKVFPKVCD